MINSGMTQIDDLIPGRVDVKYHPVAEDQEWRIPFVKELIDIKYDDLAVPGMTKTELEQILNFCALDNSSSTSSLVFIQLRLLQSENGFSSISSTI